MMTLAGQLKLIRGAFWPWVLATMALVAVSGIALELMPIWLVAAVVAAGVGATKAWQPVMGRWMLRAARRRVQEQDAAVTAGDAATIERIGPELDDYYRVAGLAAAAAYALADTFSQQERWTEALAALATGDGAALHGPGD